MRPGVAERRAARRTPESSHPYLSPEMLRGDGLRVYLDVYGCQMNVNDTEVVWSILEDQGYLRTLNPSDADVWLVVTCSIRDGAEQKVWSKLNHIQRKKSRKRKKRKRMREKEIEQKAKKERERQWPARHEKPGIRSKNYMERKK